jgi:glycosyltransferase involved in cell wall biosynthesis
MAIFKQPFPLRPTLSGRPRAGKRDWRSFPWASPRHESREIYRPLLSIVLPVYNQARYLPAALRSILRENDYPLELIIVDDGSTDNPAAVVAPYLNDSRVRFFQQTNHGLAAALNRGFEFCRGTFLSWTSADNLFKRGSLEALAGFLIANPAVAAVYADVELINERGHCLANSDYRRPNQAEQCGSHLQLPMSAETLWSYNDNFINACFMYRRSAAAQTGLYSIEKNGYEDYDFWLRIGLVGQLAHLDDDQPQYQYRLHSASMTADLRATNLAALQRSSVLDANRKRLFIHSEKPSAVTFRLLTNGSREQAYLDSLCRILSDGPFLLSEHSPESAAGLPDSDRENSWRPVLEISSENGSARLRSFLPATHSRKNVDKHYYSGDLCELSVVQLCSPAASGQASLFLPPLDLPPLLRRAREENHGAVIPHPGSRASILLLLPLRLEIELQTRVVSLIEKFGEFTWVVFCRTSAERQFADDVNISLKNNSNLRIVDASHETDSNWLPPSDAHYGEESWQERSLMFVLSSVDCVASLMSGRPKIEELLTLRRHLAISAAGGRSLVAVCREQEQPPAALNSDSRLLLAEDPESELRETVRSLVFDAPHLFFSLGETANQDDFRRKTLEAGATRPLASLNQWLEEQSSPRYRRRLKTLLSFAE